MVSPAVADPVILRDVTASDLPILYEHQLDEEAAAMAAFPTREWRAFMAHWTRVLSDERNLTRAIVTGGRVAGNVGSFEHDGRREVGYWIGREFWGRGIATRALQSFLEVETRRPLHASVAAHNAASIRVLQKCGFQRVAEAVAADGVEELLFRLDASPRQSLRPTEIAAFLDAVLRADSFRAEEPENVLLIDADRPVGLLGAAVNTTFAAIARAAELGVGMLLVHHPSWPDIDLGLHERKMERLRELGVSLYGAHASLDAAPNVGTGDSLARGLGIEVEARFAEYHGAPAGVYGPWEGTLAEFVDAVTRATGAQPEVHANANSCDRVAILTGGGGLTGWLDEAAELGCDTYLTGEGSMYTRLWAKEAGVNLVLAGHYRTEAPGIRSLAEHAADRLGLDWVFIEDDPIG